MMRIREAVDGDCEVLSGLNEAFNGVTRSSQQIKSFIRAGGSAETVLVVEDSGVVVGFACLQTLRSFCYDSPWVEITELYVAPSHRRSGAGAGLVDDAIRRAALAGATEILVRTNAKNEPAKGLFIEHGLQPAPHVVFRCPMEPA
jgi:ribosomal protein S18 acetylase RimI-like enzyme